MAKKRKEPNPELLAAIERGIAEADRRNAGAFDGLMGSFQGDHSKLLTDISHYLRGYLLDHCSRLCDEDKKYRERVSRSKYPGKEALNKPSWISMYMLRKRDSSPEELARALLLNHLPREGFRTVAPVPDDVELVLGLVNMIASVFRVDPEYRDELIYGKAGVRGKKSQAIARNASGKGGEARRVQAWNEWRERCVREASTMLVLENERREIAGRLASKYHKSPQTVRKLLAQHLK